MSHASTKERVRWKPLVHVYKNYFARNFIGYVGGKLFNRSNCNEDGHFRYKCPNE